MPVELITIAVAVVLSAISEAALEALAASRFRDDATAGSEAAPRALTRDS